jgi:PKD domain
MKKSVLFILLLCILCGYSYANDSILKSKNNSIIINKTICFGDSVLLTSNFVGQQYKWYYLDTLISSSASIYAKKGGMYHSEVFDSTGTTSYDTANVFVSDDIRPKLPDDFKICKGDTVRIGTSVKNKVYKWNTGANTSSILIEDSGLYTLQIIDTILGCTSYDTVRVETKGTSNSNWRILYMNTPTITFLAEAISGGILYLWDFGDPSSNSNSSQLASPSHKFSSQGIYTISLTTTNVTNNCSSTTKRVIILDRFPQFVSSDKEIKLNIYPNPISDKSIINYELKNEHTISIELFDLMGRKIKTIENNVIQNPGKYSYLVSDYIERTNSLLYLKFTIDGESMIAKILN